MGGGGGGTQIKGPSVGDVHVYVWKFSGAIDTGGVHGKTKPYCR